MLKEVRAHALQIRAGCTVCAQSGGWAGIVDARVQVARAAARQIVRCMLALPFGAGAPLLQPHRLAHSVAQIIQLGATNDTLAFDFNFGDSR